MADTTTTQEKTGLRMAKSAMAAMLVGSLLMVWSALWLIYLFFTASETLWLYIVATGLFLTGAIFFVGVFLAGKVGRQASEAADAAVEARRTADRADARRHNHGHESTHMPPPRPGASTSPTTG